jgi:hypothetical protein
MPEQEVLHRHTGGNHIPYAALAVLQSSGVD